MYFSKTTFVSFSLLASSSLVAGHAAIIGATGDAGGNGTAIGVDPNTPRDGTGRNPFQQDATRFKGDAADICGETLGGGNNDIQAGTAQVMALSGATLPQVSAGGQIMMTVHQVNSDGAGPYTCMVDPTANGTNWQPATVTTNLPGNDRGRNRDTQLQDQPLTVAMPAGMTCTGTVAGQTNVCMVRCQNPARAGPFGGCVPVQMAGAGAAAPAAGAAAPAAAAPAANGAAPAANGAAPVANGATGAATGATGATGVNTGSATGQVANGAAPAANAGGATQQTGSTQQTGAGVQSGATQQTGSNQQTGSTQQTGAGVQSGATQQTGAGVQSGANQQTGATQQNGAGVQSGATGATGATTGSNTAINGPSARKRAAARNQPALTNDDQEEEIDLLGDEVDN